MNKKIRFNVALSLALLFHISGLIGILFTTHKDWFIQNTCLHLLLMAGLLVFTHPVKDKRFFVFFIVAFVIGFIAEVIGVNTGFIFGAYSYGNVLGIKLFRAPLIIGINWFIIVYCAGMFTQAYENYLLRKINEKGIIIKNQMMFASFIIDATVLVFMFDWIMEPVAVKLGYWQWVNNNIPLYNYISWIIISSGLLIVFRKLNRNQHNIFAVHLFIIQVLFFVVLRTFL
ncbi:MAG TPA: carotenoid biosynthesis protein [Parafilimonas sp.]|nr:carotenoid biosynthesis protein [Parafilimonas sp.]